MKTALSITLLAVLLTGCQSTIVSVRKEPYPVYISIPTTQKPPAIEKCDLQVDKLTDNADAGTIAQAYKYDMECLRSKIVQYDTILKQYENDSKGAEEVRKEIEKSFEQVLEQYRKSIAAAEKDAVGKGVKIEVQPDKPKNP